MRHALGAVLLVSGVACSEIEEPSPPELHGVAVFEGPNEFGTIRPWVINLDGSGLMQLWLPMSGDVKGPAISPDGRKVVVESAYNLYVANVDGSDWHAVLMDPPWDEDPAWSPDGSRLAFISNRDDERELYVVNLDGSGELQLTDTPGVSERGPSWSPDGLWLAYSADEPGSGDPVIRHLIKTRSDGSSSPQQVTSGAFVDFDPAWSPVDSRIVFASNRAGAPALFMTNAEGVEPVPIRVDGFADLRFPAWSPDGTELLFSCDLRLCRALADGSEVRSLTDGATVVFSPQWVP